MKQVIHFLKLAWKTSPSYILLVTGKAFFSSAQLLLNIYIMKLLVDELLTSRDVKLLVIYGISLILVDAGILLILKIFEALIEPANQKFRNSMLGALSTKIMNLEYSYLEDPYYLDIKERAQFAIYNQDSIAKVVNQLAVVLTKLFTVVGLMGFLASLGWVLFAALFVSISISLGFIAYMMKTIVKLQKSIIPINRKMTYYMQVMEGKQYQKDIRLFDMTDMIADRTLGFVKQCADEFDKAFKAQGVANAGVEVASTGLAAFSYAWVGIRAFSDKFGPRISIGSLTMYVTSIINLSSASMALGEAFVGMAQHAAFLQPYLEFMSLEEETKEAGKEIFKGPIDCVSFQNVSFTYPKAEKAILTDISFDVHKGEKISIVGLNGAGKSTLVKLLCRMYRVDSGQILVNGKSIYDYDYMSYMKELSAVFQDYKLFNFTIEENISCMQENTKEEEVLRLLKEVDLKEKVDQLPNGIKSRFGKEYDEEGVEFSGGQGQKVAIARALYKEASMVILDEPASALDPIAEAEIYEKFNSLVADKTAIYISHRMSSSVFCDKILILDGGSVSDFDTHENLMNKTDSLYYKLFMAQADNYALE